MQDISFWTAVGRGIRGGCPNCGAGALFKAYLKPVDDCASCKEPLGHIRADDGPAWLTILLVGHILAPFLLVIQPRVTLPDWVAVPIWVAIGVGLLLVLLPRTKGAFIGAIWKTKGPGSETV